MNRLRSRVSRLLAFTLVMGAGLVAVNSVSAVADVGDSAGPVDFTQEWNAYVGPGEHIGVSLTFRGRSTQYTPRIGIELVSPAGVTSQSSTPWVADGAAHAVNFSGASSPTPGVWKIKPVLLDAVGVPASTPPASWQVQSWAINVANSAGTVKNGRVWTDHYDENQYAAADQTLYWLGPNGAQYKTHASPFNGVMSSTYANNLGNTDPSCVSVHRSVEQSEVRAGTYEEGRTCPNAIQYRAFFAAPDAGMPATAQWYDGTTRWVYKPFQNPALSQLAYTQTASGANYGGTFTTNVTGQDGRLTLRIDTDNNGSFTGPADVTMRLSAGLGTASIPWDGRDANGNPISLTKPIAAKVTMDAAAEVHFPQVDVELRGGRTVTALTGTRAGQNAGLYWDDSALSDLCTANGGAKVTCQGSLPALTGENVTAQPTHGWGTPNNTTNTWGDNRVIDEWTFTDVDASATTSTVTLNATGLVISKTSADTTLLGRQPTTHAVTARNTGVVDLVAQTVTDDLSGVLANADLDESSLQASSGTVAFDAAAQQITWTGNVAAGQSVTFSYRLIAHDVTTAATLHDEAKAPAWNAKAELDQTVKPLGRLAVRKNTSAQSFAAVGDTVAYTFEVSNPGTTTVSDIVVTDPKVTGITCPKTALTAGESMTCTADPYPTTTADAQRGYATNTAHAAGTVADPAGGSGDTLPVGGDSNTVIVPGKGALTVRKSTTATSFARVGDPIAYTFEVTNSGTAPVHDIALTDPKVTGITCPKTALTAGESMTCTANPYATTAADAARGYATNKAHAGGLVDDPRDPGADPAGVGADSNTVIVPGKPSLSVAKSTTSNSFDQVGDEIAYTFAVTNTGTTPIENIVVSDPKVAGITCPKTDLAAGESMTCTADPYPTTAADAARGYATNTAHVSGLADDPTNPGVKTAVGGDSNTVVVPGKPGLTVRKRTTATSFDQVGDPIAYTFEVANSGAAPVHDIVLTDPRVGGLTCPKAVLDAGESMTCTANPYTTTAADAARGYASNTAHVSGLADDPTDPAGDPKSLGGDSNTVVVPGKAVLAVRKSTAATTFDAVGDPIAYTFEVSNDGTAPIHDIALTDPKVSGIDCPKTALNAGESMTCTADPYATTAADAARGYATNKAHVAGLVDDPTDPDADPAPIGRDSNTVIVPGKPGLNVQKNSSVTSFERVGETIAYTFRVANTGTTPIHDIALTDPQVAGVDCPKTALDAGESMTCTAADYTVTAADIARGYATNTAHVAGLVDDPSDPDADPTPIDEDSNTVVTPGKPGLNVQKRADATAFNAVGDPIAYTFEVSNTGATPIHDIALTDPKVTGITCPKTALTAGESMTCTADPYATTAADAARGYATNTARVAGLVDDPSDPDADPAPIGRDSDPVIVPGTPAISVHKSTAATSFARVGDPIAYTFEVANTGTAPIHDIAVTDPKVSGITCPKTALTAGESMTCTADPYPTTTADADRGYATNTSHVSGLVDDPTDPDADPAPIGTDSNTVRTPGVPALNVHKSADPTTFDQVGDAIDYTFTVANTGTAPIHDIAVTDPKVSGITCP